LPSMSRVPPAPFSFSAFQLSASDLCPPSDGDLAMLYGVSTKALNQAFRRNRSRFPDDFVFQLRILFSR
jgi:hypothetical protein